ncbi:DUF1996 domain-containing protein [Actinoplanes awajinensis]|uniref:DUF1996 domain-containing protein n=1 Tax=Actinoplanes awajinensis subsp. mycoplanecinus TaxID=135947 RepID=A0A0X3UNP0_9ACTN|nr:DUF1996 domain-containing protein [Actinoplanes awajinensis]KUL34228.1 hypothetical protein ADL15_16460 [Actinoplanes awajinensis subsp. mycoplanecinus]
MPSSTFREPDPTPARPGRHARRPRALAIAAAGVAVALIAGAAVWASRPDAATEQQPQQASADRPPATPPAGQAAAPASASAPTSAAVSASTKAAPASKAATQQAAAAPKGGWIPVDQAAWNTQLAKYQATKAQAPGDAGNLPEFRADCKYSHRKADDPIVFPGLPGASHMHSFVGNKAVDAGTTAGDLTKFTATTCKPTVDHSAYWVPTLYEAATKKPVETTGFRVYYRSIRTNSTGIVPIPNGLRMIAGDAKKKKPTPRGTQGQFYCAFYGPGNIDGDTRSTNGNWPICGNPATLHYQLQFPDCWDGKNLDSPNHKDHVAFGTNDGCPAAHPVRIPALTFDIAYGAKGTKAGYYLSSDPDGKSASSMHGDAFLMWDAAAMNQRVRNCIAQRRTCNNTGYDPFSY